MTSGLFSLFAGSLLASTVLPGGVEVLLYYLFQSREYSTISLLSVATAGNTLGACITFYMGYLLAKGLSRFRWYDKVEKLFSLNPSALSRVRELGVPVLFFSWMPIIGDPLCVAAGYLKLPVWPSVMMIFFGKLVRYAVLLWAFAQPWATAPV